RLTVAEASESLFGVEDPGDQKRTLSPCDDHTAAALGLFPNTTLELFLNGERASGLIGLKVKARIARRTRVAVAADTLAAPVITRDTVAVETDALLATSRIPMSCLHPSKT